MKVSMFCDPKETSMKLIGKQQYPETCMIELKYTTSAGCPKITEAGVATFIKNNYIPIGATLIIAGILLAFFGKHALKLVIFLVGGLSVAFALAYTSLSVIYSKSEDPADWMLYTALGGSLLVGLCVGACLVSCQDVGAAVIAGTAGASVGVLITQAAMITSSMAHWGIVGACAVGAVILACVLKDIIRIVVTSFIGSYMAVRGISLFAGHYPDEFQLAREIEGGYMKWDNFDKIFFAYIAGILVLTILSACFQARHSQNKSRNETGH